MPSAEGLLYEVVDLWRRLITEAAMLVGIETMRLLRNFCPDESTEHQIVLHLHDFCCRCGFVEQEILGRVQLHQISVYILIAGDEDEFGVLILVSFASEGVELNAVELRHLDIGNDKVDIGCIENIARLGPILCCCNRVTIDEQYILHQH